ncbi:type III-B CRISPR module RAMP protein Cmr4 [Pyrinomonas methylaliphatogenes]|uniref:CRISPR type III-B/RAMP module RAMP protein Cmr4 n=1 Tax=Pyrinomonas methylaliphatogenes TaxID=454194 RepID=A0A0B6X2H1_9BACT|nr:type III-B CRISPR module RAMP protein Cmr4 [Pyrinomonas methylaliphatogenes]CDM67157.1 CRISPR type III-B/RAMP module RAMP protein Cmr4 [Pyrinomonas methylaliphatogenes]
MFDCAGMLFLYTETLLHAGSGTSLGVVDLPIQRERTTGYPMIQASGLKGCLRDVMIQASGLKGCLRDVADSNCQKVEIVFGPDTQRASDHAGALSVGDARILLFPVRSLMGVFAWVTSQNVLARFKREAMMAGLSVDWDPPGPPNDSTALIQGNLLVANGKIVLEEFAFTAQTDSRVEDIAKWLKENALPSDSEYAYWRDTLEKRLVILPDNDFQYFVQFSTEVIARVRIDDTKKTVERGGLWTEEHLPSETLLYATLFASKPRVKDEELPDDWKQANDRAGKILEFVKQAVDGKRLQLGGDATVGRGIVKVRFVEGQARAQTASAAQRGGQP